MTKKGLVECSSTLEFFLVDEIIIYIFQLADTKFSILTKNALEVFKLEKEN